MFGGFRSGAFPRTMGSMRRADRLFHIIQLLRGRQQAVTAARLAERLGVSDRTVYRDIRDLIATGTPIEGEAGVGYTLRREYDLPPLMFQAEELEAIVLGARLVRAFGDESLARAASTAISKVETVLPKRIRDVTERPALYAPRTPRASAGSGPLVEIRNALAERKKLRLVYQTGDGTETERVIRPLGAFFWGTTWTVTSWCELRSDFRTFRLDRIVEADITEEVFVEEDGRTLRDYLRREGHMAERLLDD